MLFDLRSGGRRTHHQSCLSRPRAADVRGLRRLRHRVAASRAASATRSPATAARAGATTRPSSAWRPRSETPTAKTKATPTDAAAWAALAQARVRLAAVGDNFDSAASDYTAEGRRQLTAAGAAWDKYIALDPPKPDERLARQMSQAYISLNNLVKAVGVQEVVTADRTDRADLHEPRPPRLPVRQPPQGRPRRRQGRRARAHGQEEGAQGAAGCDEDPGPAAAAPAAPADPHADSGLSASPLSCAAQPL